SAREPVTYASSFLVLAFEQPAPQISIGCAFAVKLDVEASVLEVSDLLRVQVDRARDRSARRVRNSQVEQGGTADAPCRTLVKPGVGGGRLEAVEGARDGEFGPRQGCGCRSRTGDRRLHREVDRHGRKSRSKGFPRLGLSRQ